MKRGALVSTPNIYPPWPRARENASDRVAIGFSFAFDWLRGWREFSRPITERRKAKPMQFRIAVNTQLKIALFQFYMQDLVALLHLP